MTKQQKMILRASDAALYLVLGAAIVVAIGAAVSVASVGVHLIVKAELKQ